MATTIEPSSSLREISSRLESRPEQTQQVTLSALDALNARERTALSRDNPSADSQSQRTPLLDAQVAGLPNPADTRLSIDRDKDTGRFVYRVLSTTTGEVLRQFPAEEALRIARRFAHPPTGKIVDETT